MTQEEVMEQVREKIEDIIFFKTRRFKARLILEIPEILIKAPNQDLPDNMNKDNIKYNDDYTTGYLNAQQEMLTPKDGYVWMKVKEK